MPDYLCNILYTLYGIIKILEYKHINNRYLPFLRYVDSSDKTTIKDLQTEKLRKILIHAADHSQFYKSELSKYDLNTFKIKDLPKLDILSKDKLIHNYKDITSVNFHKYKPVRQSSGGTTGTTANFLVDKKQYLWKEAEVLLHWERHGFKPGEKKTVMYRAGVFYPKDATIPAKPWRIDYARKFLYLSSYYSSDDYFYAYYKRIHEWNPIYMHVLPSAGFLFADFLNKNKLTLAFDKVFTASEKLYSYQRNSLEKAFQCKVIDHYGHGEPGVYSAGQCKFGNYHICDSNTIVEVLDDGSIVETCLNNFSMPFIRYKVGDLISNRSNSMCRCGLATSFFGDVEGRDSEVIYTADNRVISSIGFDQIFKDNNIKLGQIVQYDHISLDIYIVPGPEFTKKNRQSLINELQLRVGMQTKINFELVSDIPLADNGKYRMVISKINKQ